MEVFFHYLGWTMLVGMFSFIILGIVVMVIVREYNEGRVLFASIIFVIFFFLAMITILSLYLFSIGAIKGYIIDIIGFIDVLFYFILFLLLK